MTNNKKNIICGFDVSGSELRLEIYTKTVDGQMLVQGERIKRRLDKGFHNIIGTLGDMIAEGTNNITDMQSLTISLPLPARFQIAGPNGTYRYPEYEDGTASIQNPLSGMHLGEDCWEKDWADALTQALRQKIPKLAGVGAANGYIAKVAGNQSIPLQVVILNDASAQMEAVLRHAKNHGVDTSAWKGGKLAFIAPGTGFGTTLAEVDPNGSIKIRHNAQMYDAMVEITSDQERRIRDTFKNFEIVTRDIDEFSSIRPEAIKAFGHFFPLEVEEKKRIYLLSDGDKKYILPGRFFASKDGLQHLLEVESDGLARLGKTPKSSIEAPYQNKLKLIGELLGNYFVQLDRESLKRVPFPGAPPIPFDAHFCNADGRNRCMPTKAILMGGGGLRDTIGDIIQSEVERIIKQDGSDILKKAIIYRPDVRTQQPEDVGKPLYNICLSAAERAGALLAQQIRRG